MTEKKSVVELVSEEWNHTIKNIDRELNNLAVCLNTLVAELQPKEEPEKEKAKK